MLKKYKETLFRMQFVPKYINSNIHANNDFHSRSSS